MRLIDADALMETLQILYKSNRSITPDTAISNVQEGVCSAYLSAIEVVQDAPTIDELEKRNEPIEPIKPEELWICGACGEGTVGWDDWIDDDTRYNYCPICGRAVKW